jgi:hypothetical protein
VPTLLLLLPAFLKRALWEGASTTQTVPLFFFSRVNNNSRASDVPAVTVPFNHNKIETSHAFAPQTVG